ncbi:serpin family protein [Nocardia sp. NPDC050718]|uniref:serpin family protein n=1 Tax=Nocardia sp. NPDC050718 TaxID=3155788 RepID=UPI00340C3F85
MGSRVALPVRSSNALTARWTATFADDDAVVSGASAWVLLALLAGAAQGAARAELAAAVEVSAESAHRAGLELLHSLDSSADVALATGAWVRPGIALRDEWVRSMPEGSAGTLVDQAALDAWASERTGGLIETFPVTVDASTVFALATALVARTRWVTPFQLIRWTPESGPWQGHQGPGLYRTGHADGSVSVLGTDVTRVIVTGTGDLDVHLLIGADGPRQALATGLAALDGAIPDAVAPTPDTTAPCLTVLRRKIFGAGGDRVQVQLPPFEVRGAHDLTRHAALFGLGAAGNAESGHFPGISDTPLAVSAAGQHVMARFDAEGFEAAAVTAVAMRMGSVPQEQWSTITSVRIDRPFGFLAVHRPTGTAVVAGQVTRPPLEWATSPPSRHTPGGAR